MNRKQVDISVRVLRFNPNEPGMSGDENSKYIRDNYLSQGWELFHTEVAQVTAGTDIFVAFTFLKYEVPSDTSNRKPVGEPAKEK